MKAKSKKRNLWVVFWFTKDGTPMIQEYKKHADAMCRVLDLRKLYQNSWVQAINGPIEVTVEI